MKNLKIILVLVTVLGFVAIDKCYAVNPIDLNEKFEEVVKFKNGDLLLEKNRADFVNVSFKINKQGKLEILDLNYSNEIIKEQLLVKLSEITVEENEDFQKVYNYKFSFKKV